MRRSPNSNAARRPPSSLSGVRRWGVSGKPGLCFARWGEAEIPADAIEHVGAGPAEEGAHFWFNGA